MISYRRFTFWLLIASALHAADFPLAVGLVTEAGGNAKIQRANTQTLLPTYAGELVFPGDSLFPNGTKVAISFCPNGQSYVLTNGQMSVEAKRVTLNGKAGSGTALEAPCEAPAITYKTYRDVKTGADRLQAAPIDLSHAQESLAAPNPTVEQLNQVIKNQPADLTAITTRAIEWERANQFKAAALDYQGITEIAPDALWAADQMRAVLAADQRTSGGEGKMIAVVVGVSDYPNLSPQENLHFADRDAEYFYNFLITPRGRARPLNIQLLLNEQATLAAVRLAINNAFAKAQPHDQVVLYIASHGIPIDSGANSGAYIALYDSSTEDPDSMYPMANLEEVTQDRLRPRNVQVIADACYAANIGGVDTHSENLFLTDFVSKRRAEVKVLGLLASSKSEQSYECSNLESGHGAFTYFLVRGLNSDKDAVDDTTHQITVYSLFEYVRDNVVKVTKAPRRHQTPQKIGNNINDDEVLARLELPGNPQPADQNSAVSCDIPRGLPQKIPTPHPSGPSLLDQTSQEIAAYLNAGQQVILRYLKGEQVAMTRDDFEQCETSFSNASKLQGRGDRLTEAKLLFCTGRKLIYDKRLAEASANLEQAIRRDPLGAYSYNALGIAYLEKPDFNRAIAAFQDAISLAPNWAYARHNLALALSEEGQYAQAIATYRAAMRLGPQYSYIPFNLGLLYERLNQPANARAAWQDALSTSPNMARAWTAIGLSYSLEGRNKSAEQAYRTALEMACTPANFDKTDCLPTRHDFALLLVKEQRTNEALALWRTNLKDDQDDLPSLVGLGDALYQYGDFAGAEPIFSHLLGKKPEYAGARLKYAHVLVNLGMRQEAAAQLEVLRRASPDNTEACEMLGDLKAESTDAGDHAEALQLYKRALPNATVRSQRSRIKKKMHALAHG